jgi:hypothetical protein
MRVCAAAGAARHHEIKFPVILEGDWYPAALELGFTFR